MSTPYKADLQRQYTELEGFCARQKVRIDALEKEVADLRSYVAASEETLLRAMRMNGKKPPEPPPEILGATPSVVVVGPRPIPLQVRTMRFDDPTWG